MPLSVYACMTFEDIFISFVYRFKLELVSIHLKKSIASIFNSFEGFFRVIIFARLPEFGDTRDAYHEFTSPFTWLHCLRSFPACILMWWLQPHQCLMKRTKRLPRKVSLFISQSYHRNVCLISTNTPRITKELGPSRWNTAQKICWKS